MYCPQHVLALSFKWQTPALLTAHSDFRQEWVVTSKPVNNDDYQLLLSPKLLLYAEWVPNSGSGLIFVENYSVFYTPDVSAESDRKVYPISSIESTRPEVVIHGVPDWIYEGTGLLYPVLVTVKISLNYIKQNRLKDHVHLWRGPSIQMLCTHEYDIPLARVDHGEGPHVFTFLISAFVFELWS